MTNQTPSAELAGDNAGLAGELEAKLNACRTEGLTFKCGCNLIDATIRALRQPQPLTASCNDVLRKALEQIKHSIGQARIPGNDWRRELALIENTVAAALSTTPTMSAEDMREAAAKVAEQQYADHPATTARAVNYRHAGRRIATAIRSLPLTTPEQSQ